MWTAISEWWSRFRSKPTTREQLEQIEADIQSIEDYKWSKLRQQKNLMALVFYGSGLLYTIVAILFYFFFLPNSYNLYDKCIYSLPLFVLPAIAYLLQRTMRGYFRWVLENNEDRLTELRKQKRKILDRVMETETYKVAKELLEKFDPSSLKPEKSEPLSPQMRLMSPQQQQAGLNNQSLRFRGSPSQQQPHTPVARHFSTNNSDPSLNSPYSQTGNRNSLPNLPPAGQQQPQQFTGQGNRPVMTVPRLIRPVLPAERSVVEKMVDLVVGDGPNNRYALICCFCHFHNGMALKDEFEYLSFKCCYCGAYNPARKLRPSAPRITSALSPVGEVMAGRDAEKTASDAGTNDDAVDKDTAEVDAGLNTDVIDEREEEAKDESKTHAESGDDGPAETCTSGAEL